LGEVHALAGNTNRSRSAYEKALELYEAKGNDVEAARTRSVLQLELA
jgi:hypothetical protein